MPRIQNKHRSEITLIEMLRNLGLGRSLDDYREVIDERRKRNVTLDKVVRGDTSFIQEMNNVYQMFYQDIGVAHIPHILTRSETRIEDLEDIFGNLYVDQDSAIADNPVFYGSCIGVAYGVLKSLGDNEITRREFLAKTTLATFYGSAWGEIKVVGRYWVFANIMKDASSFDYMINKIYKK